MQNTILVDAGPLIALFNRVDKHHKRVLRCLETGQFRLLSTVAVITEVSHMLSFSLEAQIAFFQWVLDKGVLLHPIETGDLPRVIALTRKYADRPMDFADATLVITAEQTGIRHIISIDADFDIYRLPGKERIQNILPA
jgi:predicted nucleic acid-binding protein